MGLFRRTPRARRGLVRMTYTHARVAPAGRPVQLEVEEVERKNELSRVRVIRAGGIDRYDATVLMPVWLEQDQVSWFTEGSA